MNIGVFDSGKGGSFVAAKLQNLLPEHNFIVVNDHEHVPYGNRSESEIYQLTEKALQPLINNECKIIVIACNTATALAINKLRLQYTDIVFVGYEPMLKPAFLDTKTRKVAILATPATLKSQRYLELKELWADNILVIEPDCSSWAKRIEDGNPPYQEAKDLANELLAQGVDQITLACTHYLALEDTFLNACGENAAVKEPTPAVAKRIATLMIDSAPQQ